MLLCPLLLCVLPSIPGTCAGLLLLPSLRVSPPEAPPEITFPLLSEGRADTLGQHPLAGVVGVLSRRSPTGIKNKWVGNPPLRSL